MRKRLACFLLTVCIFLALFTACGSADKVATESNGVDYNQYTNSPGFYADTGSSYVVLDQDMLYFLEPTLSVPLTVLCAKADCDHTDPDACTAYLPEGAYSLYTWNGALYSFGWDFTDGLCLYRMGLDGQNRKRAAVLDIDTDSGAVSYIPFVACGNIALYFVDSTPAGDVNKLYLFSMEHPDAEPILLFSNEEQVGQPDAASSDPVYLTEDWTFYMVHQGPRDARTCSLWGYRISTGENRELIPDGFFPADDLALEGESLLWYDVDGTLFTIDLTNGEVTELAKVLSGESVFGAMDDQWLYNSDMENMTLNIYDHKGNEVQQLSSDTALCYAFSAQDKVFFKDFGNMSMLPVGYLDKNAIVSGEASLISLE